LAVSPVPAAEFAGALELAAADALAGVLELAAADVLGEVDGALTVGAPHAASTRLVKIRTGSMAKYL
jgi:hypothetical protein